MRRKFFGSTFNNKLGKEHFQKLGNKKQVNYTCSETSKFITKFLHTNKFLITKAMPFPQTRGKPTKNVVQRNEVQFKSRRELIISYSILFFSTRETNLKKFSSPYKENKLIRLCSLLARIPAATKFKLKFSNEIRIFTFKFDPNGLIINFGMQLTCLNYHILSLLKANVDYRLVIGWQLVFGSSIVFLFFLIIFSSQRCARFRCMCVSLQMWRSANSRPPFSLQSVFTLKLGNFCFIKF